MEKFKILVLQPYIGRTIDDIKFTAKAAFEIAQQFKDSFNYGNMYPEQLELISVPEEVERLYPSDLIDSEDRILYEQPFIFTEYIKAIEDADEVLILDLEDGDHNCYIFNEMDVFTQYIVNFYANPYENELARKAYRDKFKNIPLLRSIMGYEKFDKYYMYRCDLHNKRAFINTSKEEETE